MSKIIKTDYCKTSNKTFNTKNILFAIESPKLSGPNIVANIFADYFRNIKKETNNESRLFTTDVSKINNLKTSNNLKVIEIYKFKNLIWALFNFYKFDGFNFYCQTFNALIIASLMYIFNKKVFFTVHGDLQTELNSKKGLKKFFWLPIHYYIFFISSKLFFPSEFNLNVNKKYLFKNQITCILQNPYKFSDNLLKRPLDKIEFNKFLIVTSFNHEKKQKGIDFLSNVLYKLNQNNTNIDNHNTSNNNASNFKLIIIGGGINLEKYKDKYKNREDLQFLGYQSQEVIKDYLNKIGMVLYVSYQDNMPMAILESVSAGNLVFSSNVGAVYEMLPKEFVLDYNEDLFVENILNVYKDQDIYYNLVAKEFNFAKQKFDVKKVYNLMLDLVNN